MFTCVYKSICTGILFQNAKRHIYIVTLTLSYTPIQLIMWIQQHLTPANSNPKQD